VNTSEILNRAADLIDAAGLAKGKHINRKGCLCSAGAMYAAVGIEPKWGRAPEEWPGWTVAGDSEVRVAFDAFGWWLIARGFDAADAADWNDKKGRTKEEVVAALRGAAEAARAEQ
jgi:hypothetical protein